MARGSCRGKQWDADDADEGRMKADQTKMPCSDRISIWSSSAFIRVPLLQALFPYFATGGVTNASASAEHCSTVISPSCTHTRYFSLSGLSGVRSYSK